jgi:hypothetical protein
VIGRENDDAGGGVDGGITALAQVAAGAAACAAEVLGYCRPVEAGLKSRSGRRMHRWETPMRLFYALLLLLGGITAVAGDIRIDESRYFDGKLIIAGETELDRAVILDNKYKIKSDASGHFTYTGRSPV